MGLGHESPVKAAADLATNAPAEFQINDADGVAHRYMTARHGATDGQELMWELVAFGGEPLGAVAKKLYAASQMEGIDASVIESIDWAQLGKDIAASVRRTNMSVLSARLLVNTWRDDQPLKNPSVFNTAYTGNYGELMQVLLKVVMINRFLPL